MKKDPKNWKGCFAAVVTPFKENEDLDEESFCKNIELLINEGIYGIVVSGCTGESWALSDEERKTIFNLATEQAKDRIITVGGVGETTPKHTIKLARYAKEAGMDMIMIHPPARVIPNPREIIAFYQKISNSVDMPILLYNIPKRQAVELNVDLVDKLADIKNVVAIKESSNNFERVMEVVEKAGDQIQVFTGHSAQRGVPAILMGAKGWVGSLEPQVMGKEAIEMYNHVINGDLNKAEETQYRCMVLNNKMGGGKSGTFPAFVKYGMNLRGRPGGFPRKPILDLTEQEKKHVRSMLQELNLL
ncbi:4-hydroxy-tetrahydrodipicolinate synthase [bacterium]|nr:4-hydroxy-tetrahydrodipicolinate synthase [bacterium]